MSVSRGISRSTAIDFLLGSELRLRYQVQSCHGSLFFCLRREDVRNVHDFWSRVRKEVLADRTSERSTLTSDSADWSHMTRFRQNALSAY